MGSMAGGTDLSRIPSGASARIVSYVADTQVARRLISLGAVPGARVRVVRRSPLGDPIIISVRGTVLAARRRDLRNIEVNEC